MGPRLLEFQENEIVGLKSFYIAYPPQGCAGRLGSDSRRRVASGERESLRVRRALSNELEKMQRQPLSITISFLRCRHTSFVSCWALSLRGAGLL
jgi:hypothetical protein